jgi:hypothetical protein
MARRRRWRAAVRRPKSMNGGSVQSQNFVGGDSPKPPNLHLPQPTPDSAPPSSDIDS